MLTLVINPGGTARVVTIAEALFHLGVGPYQSAQAVERTPEERRQLRKERRRRLQEQRGTER